MKCFSAKNILLIFCMSAAIVLWGCGKTNEQKSLLTVDGSPGRVLKVDRVAVVKLDKTLSLQLTPGNHLLEITEPGYETVYSRSVFKPGKKYRLKPEMQKIHSSVLIESIPSGASVEFNGSVKGTTPLVIRDLAIGTHKAHIEMPGYARREISWVVRDARPLPKLKVSLESNTAKVSINSTPAGAQVLIDDIPVGTTPFEGNFETGLHLVKLIKKGYVEHIDQINLERSAPVRKKYALRARPGIIRVISNPSGAAVSINGEKRGNAPLTLELDAGKYALQVNLEGFDPTNKSITIAPAQNEEMIVNLGSATGSARFLIFPGNVSLKLDGKDMGKVPAQGDGHREINFKNLSPGTHVLEMTHPMAQPSTRRLTFKVEKGKLYQPDNPIEIWIANCEVTYPDGRKEKGALYYETPNGILFGPSPKIKFELLNSQIKSFRRLPEQ